MCYSFESSVGGFLATWTLSFYLLGMRGGNLPWRYNAWTAAVMMTASCIQLIEARAWTVVDDPCERQEAARLLRPTLLLQPAANFLAAGWALGQRWMTGAGVAYAAWALWALANPLPNADVRRGQHGHLSWYGDTTTNRHVLQGTEAWLYMAGLFVPLLVAAAVGDARYGLALMCTLAATFAFSVTRYASHDASSLWCFWGLLYTGVGLSLNFV